MKCMLYTAVAMVVAGFTGPAAVAGDLERGKALHDTFCTACHSTGVYRRDDRLANTYLEVRQQVERWQGNAQLRWSPYDIESVAEYLSGRFYKIPH
jgi:mono/diheme cytochrome c family protein